MRQNCKFNSKSDFKESAPNLTVNLAQALESKAIPSTGTEVEHNELETSSAIGMRVRDNFEAIEAQRAITAQGKAQAKAEKAAAEKAAAEKAAVTMSTPTSSVGAN